MGGYYLWKVIITCGRLSYWRLLPTTSIYPHREGPGSTDYLSICSPRQFTLTTPSFLVHLLFSCFVHTQPSLGTRTPA